MNGALSLHPRKRPPMPSIVPSADPKELGPLLTPKEIATDILQRPEKERWVKRNMPPDLVVIIGREHLMYEQDARAWVAGLRGARVRTQ